MKSFLKAFKLLKTTAKLKFWKPHHSARTILHQRRFYKINLCVFILYGFLSNLPAFSKEPTVKRTTTRNPFERAVHLIIFVGGTFLFQ